MQKKPKTQQVRSRGMLHKLGMFVDICRCSGLGRKIYGMPFFVCFGLFVFFLFGFLVFVWFVWYFVLIV